MQDIRSDTQPEKKIFGRISSQIRRYLAGYPAREEDISPDIQPDKDI
jgi:hypothetical protein